MKPPEPRWPIHFQSPSRTTLAVCRITVTSRPADGSPRSAPRKLTLSSAAPSDSSPPAASTHVANTSGKQIVCADSLPGATAPGQRTTNGIRWPPSNESLFMPRHGPVAACPKRSTSPGYQTGPLSDVNTNSVSSDIDVSSSAAITRPTSWSTCATKSPYIPAPLAPRKRSSGSHGVCGAGSAR